mmetsp:Transcript_11766/g.41557  ORF Transcript_11766/g.41557 Transcript_11766/m.41557 type:complete len:915 (-) Transcript_11766:30-2774(-)
MRAAGARPLRFVRFEHDRERALPVGRRERRRAREELQARNRPLVHAARGAAEAERDASRCRRRPKLVKERRIYEPRPRRPVAVRVPEEAEERVRLALRDEEHLARGKEEHDVRDAQVGAEVDVVCDCQEEVTCDVDVAPLDCVEAVVDFAPQGPREREQLGRWHAGGRGSGQRRCAVPVFFAARLLPRDLALDLLLELTLALELALALLVEARRGEDHVAAELLRTCLDAAHERLAPLGERPGRPLAEAALRLAHDGVDRLLANDIRVELLEAQPLVDAADVGRAGRGAEVRPLGSPLREAARRRVERVAHDPTEQVARRDGAAADLRHDLARHGEGAALPAVDLAHAAQRLHQLVFAHAGPDGEHRGRVAQKLHVRAAAVGLVEEDYGLALADGRAFERPLAPAAVPEDPVVAVEEEDDAAQRRVVGEELQEARRDVGVAQPGHERAGVDERGGAGLDDERECLERDSLLAAEADDALLGGDCEHLAVGRKERGVQGRVLLDLEREQALAVVCPGEALGVAVDEVPRVGHQARRELHRLARQHAVVQPKVDGARVVRKRENERGNERLAREVNLRDGIEHRGAGAIEARPRLREPLAVLARLRHGAELEQRLHRLGDLTAREAVAVVRERRVDDERVRLRVLCTLRGRVAGAVRHGDALRRVRAPVDAKVDAVAAAEAVLQKAEGEERSQSEERCLLVERRVGPRVAAEPFQVYAAVGDEAHERDAIPVVLERPQRVWRRVEDGVRERPQQPRAPRVEGGAREEPNLVAAAGAVARAAQRDEAVVEDARDATRVKVDDGEECLRGHEAPRPVAEELGAADGVDELILVVQELVGLVEDVDVGQRVEARQRVERRRVVGSGRDGLQKRRSPADNPAEQECPCDGGPGPAAPAHPGARLQRRGARATTRTNLGGL